MDKYLNIDIKDIETYKFENNITALVEISLLLDFNEKETARFLGIIINYFDIRSRISSKQIGNYTNEYIETLCNVMTPPAKLYEIAGRIKKEKKFKEENIKKMISQILDQHSGKSSYNVTYNIFTDSYTNYDLTNLLNKINLKLQYFIIDYNSLRKMDPAKTINGLIICGSDIQKQDISYQDSTKTYIFINERYEIVQGTETIFTASLGVDVNQIIILAFFYHNLYLFYYFLNIKDNPDTNSFTAFDLQKLFDFYLSHFSDTELFSLASIKRLGESLNSKDLSHDFRIVLHNLSDKQRYILQKHLIDKRRKLVKKEINSTKIKVLQLLLINRSQVFQQKIKNFHLLLKRQEKVEDIAF